MKGNSPELLQAERRSGHYRSNPVVLIGPTLVGHT